MPATAFPRTFAFPGLSIVVLPSPAGDGKEALVLKLTGEIGTQALDGFHKCLEEFLAGGFVRMVLDFAEIKFMGSGGFGALLLLKSQTTSRGGFFKICRMPSYLQRVMGALGFERFFKHYDAEAEALEDLEDVTPPSRGSPLEGRNPKPE